MPTSAYATSDGHVNLGAAGEAMWVKVCEVIGRPALATDPRFAKGPDRSLNRQALNTELGAAFRTRTSAEWIDLLNAAGVPCGPIYSMDQVFSDAQVVATGMAAITLVTSLVKPGERIVVPCDCYGGSFRLFTALQRTGRALVDFVDPTDLAALAEALASPAKLLWLETPSNPLLRITDLAAAAALGHAAGALVCADNTFLSPAWQQPLSLGCDIVIHSTTKYLNGHSDVVGGAVVARDRAVHDELAWWANALGLTGSAFDSFLTLRGMRTLHARLRLHEANARVIAEALQGHPAVAAVHYPGLASHPGHALATRQQRGFGAMLSFELNGGEAAVRSFLDGLECFSLAESLGGVESLVAHPATMTHASMDPAARQRAGITDSLLRLSVGIETADDLLADLTAGLARTQG
jgi:cystathionine gamma-synthase